MTHSKGVAPEELSARGRLARVVLALFGSLLTIFSSGVIVGFLVNAMEHGFKRPLVALLVLTVAASAAAIGVWMVRLGLSGILGSPGEVVAPRIRRARIAIIAAVGIGVAMGLVMSLGGFGDDPGNFRLMGNSPIPGWIAGLLIAVWLLVVPPLTWFWHRSIDEHEAEAYRDGALAAGYAYIAIAPAWWIGWRGGFLTEPQVMPTFLVVTAVWTIVWFFRRYS